MKKTLIIILLIFFIITAWTYVFLTNLSYAQKSIKSENEQYENYLGKTIYGAELATLINKSVDYNEKNRVKKEKNGYYIENSEKSVKIEVKMKTIDKTYAMEEIYNNDITEFVRHFNLIQFKCTDILYNDKTNRVSKMVFEEIK